MSSVSWLWPTWRNLTYWCFSQCWIRVDNNRLSDIIRPCTWLNRHSTKPKNIHIRPEMSEIWLKHVWQIVLTISPLVLGGFECSLGCWNINPISQCLLMAYVIDTPNRRLESYIILTPADVGRHLDSFLFHMSADGQTSRHTLPPSACVFQWVERMASDWLV